MTKTLVERLRAKRTILRLEAAERIEELERALGRIESQRQTCTSDEVEVWELQAIARQALSDNG